MADKHLFELQNKLTESNRALSQVIQLINLNKAEQKRGISTTEELSLVKDSTPSYKSVGRMFLAEPLPSLKTQLKGKLFNGCERKIPRYAGASGRPNQGTGSQEGLCKETSKAGRRESQRIGNAVVQ